MKVELTNPDFVLHGTGFLPKGTLYLHREKFILEGLAHEQSGKVVATNQLEDPTDKSNSFIRHIYPNSYPRPNDVKIGHCRVNIFVIARP